MTNAIRFTRLDRHTIRADGEFTGSIVATLYCARNAVGQWFIGNIYINEVAGTFSPEDQDKTTVQFVKDWFGMFLEKRTDKQRERFAVLCGYLDAAETAQRERGEVLEIH